MINCYIWVNSDDILSAYCLLCNSVITNDVILYKSRPKIKDLVKIKGTFFRSVSCQCGCFHKPNNTAVIIYPFQSDPVIHNFKIYEKGNDIINVYLSIKKYFLYKPKNNGPLMLRTFFIGFYRLILNIKTGRCLLIGNKNKMTTIRSITYCDKHSYSLMSIDCLNALKVIYENKTEQPINYEINSIYDLISYNRFPNCFKFYSELNHEAKLEFCRIDKQSENILADYLEDNRISSSKPLYKTLCLNPNNIVFVTILRLFSNRDHLFTLFNHFSEIAKEHILRSGLQGVKKDICFFFKCFIKEKGELFVYNTLKKLRNFDELIDTATMFNDLKKNNIIKSINFSCSLKDIHEQLFILQNTVNKNAVYEYSKEDLKLEYLNGNYTFELPKVSKDLLLGALHLYNCVYSYESKILDKRCRIVFVKKKDIFVACIEIRKNIVCQASGYDNSPLDTEFNIVFQEYILVKSLQLNTSDPVF